MVKISYRDFLFEELIGVVQIMSIIVTTIGFSFILAGNPKEILLYQFYVVVGVVVIFVSSYYRSHHKHDMYLISLKKRS